MLYSIIQKAGTGMTRMTPVFYRKKVLKGCSLFLFTIATLPWQKGVKSHEKESCRNFIADRRERRQ